MNRFYWGIGIVAVATGLYGWHGITSSLDLMWHGAMFLLGFGLMLPQHYFDYLLATIQSVFGKTRVEPPALPGSNDPEHPNTEAPQ